MLLGAKLFKLYRGKAPATFLQLHQLCRNQKQQTELHQKDQWLLYKPKFIFLALLQPNSLSPSPNSPANHPQCSAASNPVNSSPNSSTSLWCSQQRLCYGRVSQSPQTLPRPLWSSFPVVWSPRSKEEISYSYGIEGRIRRLGKSWSTM